MVNQSVENVCVCDCVHDVKLTRTKYILSVRRGGECRSKKRHPNGFCGIRTPQLVIRHKKVNIKPLFA